MKEALKLKIGVLGGGVSPERSISLMSAHNAHKALANSGFDVVFINITSSNPEDVKGLLIEQEIDLAFLALHGCFGEDGGIQKILEDLSICYTGSDPLASRLAMDKVLSKKIFQAQGVITPDFTLYSGRGEIPAVDRFPLVVKPSGSGSSLGISIVRSRNELGAALEAALAHQDRVLIEEYIPGREVTVGILGPRALGVVEIIPQTGYYDFNAKYMDQKTVFTAPAKLSPQAYRDCQLAALAAHTALGCRDFSRVDIRLSPEGVPYVLEVNSIPGLTAHSLLPLSAEACGIFFQELMRQMVHLALSRKKAISAR
jgi:D-alanine-D-alanine ligase